MYNINDKITQSVAEAVKMVIENKEGFKPHTMYDPKTGEAHEAKTHEDHLKMKDMGYTHEKPSEKNETEVQDSDKDFVDTHTVDAEEDPEQKRQVEETEVEDEDDVEEGNAFGQAVTDAKKAGKKKFKFKGKEYKVESVNLEAATAKIISIPKGAKMQVARHKKREGYWEPQNTKTEIVRQGGNYQVVAVEGRYNSGDFYIFAANNKHYMINAKAVTIVEDVDLEEAIRVKTHRGMFSMKKGEESLRNWVDGIVIMSDAVKNKHRKTVAQNIVKAIESGKIKNADLTRDLGALIGIKSPGGMEAPDNVVKAKLKDLGLNEAIDPRKFVLGGDAKVTKREVDGMLSKLFIDTKLAKAVEANAAYQDGYKGKVKKNPFDKDTADFHLFILGQQSASTE